jgi:hypothetical protein
MQNYSNGANTYPMLFRVLPGKGKSKDRIFRMTFLVTHTGPDFQHGLTTKGV